MHDKIFKHLQKIGVTEKLLSSEITAATSESEGFMTLGYDFLYSENEKSGTVFTIALSHYYKQNGDMVPDPDMELRIFLNTEMAEALAYQDVFGYKRVYKENGGFSIQRKEELNQFLLQWLKNLDEQGHKFEEGL